MKARSLNKEQWFLDNGWIWLGLKREVKNSGLLWKIISNFTKNHSKDVFGARASVIPFGKGKLKQVDLDIQQHSNRLHCQYLKNT